MSLDLELKTRERDTKTDLHRVRLARRRLSIEKHRRVVSIHRGRDGILCKRKQARLIPIQCA